MSEPPDQSRWTRRSWPLLAISAGLTLVGGIGLIVTPGDGNELESDLVGVMLVAVGLVILGSWLTVELRYLMDKDREDCDGQD